MEALTCDPLEAAVASNATFHQFVTAVANDPRWEWTHRWWQTGCVAVQTDTGRAWEVSAPGDGIPPNIAHLGCAGHDCNGDLRWIGFDLDVGHGGTFYATYKEALADAKRIREALGEAEIRRSKSGGGIHVRHLLPSDSGLVKADAPRIVKYVARKLGLKADPSNLGRQVFWCWSRKPNAQSYEEIAAQEKSVLDLADIIVEALASASANGQTEEWAGEKRSFVAADSNDAAEQLAVKAWQPGDFNGRTPLGNRNWADVRHFAGDWGMSIGKALEIVRERGGNPHASERQWERMLQYCKYPRGWAKRKHERSVVEDQGKAEEIATAPQHLDLPQFPLDVFPEDVRGIVDSVSWVTQTPPDLPAQYCLAVLALAASRRGVHVEWKPGVVEPCNLYLLTALPPSEHKSSALKPIIRPLRELQKAGAEEAERKIVKHKTEAAILEEKIAAARRNVGKGRGGSDLQALLEQEHELKPPVKPRYLLDDVTPEQLCTIIHENYAAGIISSEASIIDNMSGRYSPTGEGQIIAYLKLFDGEPFNIDRRGRSEEVQGLLTIGCACQPTSLRRMVEVVKNARSVGLLSRFLFAMPRSRVGTRAVDDDGFDPGAMSAWAQRVARTFALKEMTLTLNADATEELRAWRREIEGRLVGDLHEVADWGGKAQAGQVCRLAGILHLCWERDKPEISAETMRKAIRLCRYYLAHANAAFASLETGPEIEMAEKVERWAETLKADDNGLKAFSLRDAMRKFTKKKTEMEPVLEFMAMVGKLRQDKQKYVLIPALKNVPPPLVRPAPTKMSEETPAPSEPAVPAPVPEAPKTPIPSIRQEEQESEFPEWDHDSARDEQNAQYVDSALPGPDI